MTVSSHKLCFKGGVFFHSTEDSGQGGQKQDRSASRGGQNKRSPVMRARKTVRRHKRYVSGSSQVQEEGSGEIPRLETDYEQLETLGRGSFGDVTKVIRTLNHLNKSFIRVLAKTSKFLNKLNDTPFKELLLCKVRLTFLT